MTYARMNYSEGASPAPARQAVQQQLPTQRTGTIPRFYTAAVENKAASKSAGRKIFREMEMVDILIVGDSKSMVTHRVTPEIADRYPREYDAFKRNVEIAAEGTPLQEWPRATKSMVAEFGALNIRTVEDLAGLSDAQVQKLGTGGLTFREQAKAYLAQAAGAAPAERLAAENEELKARMQRMDETIAALAEKVESVQVERDELVEEKRRRGGRPKKDDA